MELIIILSIYTVYINHICLRDALMFLNIDIAFMSRLDRSRILPPGQGNLLQANMFQSHFLEAV